MLFVRRSLARPMCRAVGATTTSARVGSVGGCAVRWWVGQQRQQQQRRQQRSPTAPLAGRLAPLKVSISDCRLLTLPFCSAGRQRGLRWQHQSGVEAHAFPVAPRAQGRSQRSSCPRLAAGRWQPRTHEERPGHAGTPALLQGAISGAPFASLQHRQQPALPRSRQPSSAAVDSRDAAHRTAWPDRRA